MTLRDIGADYFRYVPWLGAMYAYLFGEMTKIGIELSGESQLVGFPTQFPSVSMVDWENGKPNARTWVLRLLHDNMGPGDKLVESQALPPSAANHPYVYSVAFITPAGKKRVLLVNKRNRTFDVSVPGPEADKWSMSISRPAFSLRLR